MKKILLGAMIAVIVLSAVPGRVYASEPAGDIASAAAAGSAAEVEPVPTTVYRVDELGIEMAVPNDTVVFTRHMEENDPALTALGTTLDAVQTYMEDNYIYLNFSTPDFSQEIVVKKLQDGFEDFEFAVEDKDDLDKVMTQTYAEQGLILGNTEMYVHPQTVFYKGDYENTNYDPPFYWTHYVTIKNGYEIAVYLFSYTKKPLTEEQHAWLRAAVDSIKFDEVPATAVK